MMQIVYLSRREENETLSVLESLCDDYSIDMALLQGVFLYMDNYLSKERAEFYIPIRYTKEIKK